MVRLFWTVILVGVFFFGLKSEGKVRVDPTDEVPSVHADIGKVYRLRWSDGRQAKLVAKTYEPLSGNVDLTYRRNSCVTVKPPKCYINTRIQLRKVLYVWEKFPANIKRIGQVLRKNNKYRSVNEYTGDYPDSVWFIEPFFITQYMQSLSRNLGLSALPVASLRDSLHCDHFDWLPGTQNGRLTIPAWLTRYKAPTREFTIKGKDRLVVNQYTAGAKSIHLHRVDPHNYEIEKVDLFDTGEKRQPSMLLGYETVFSFDTQQYKGHPHRIPQDVKYPNATCEVLFSINISPITQLFYTLDNERYKEESDLSEFKDVKVSETDPHQYWFRQHFEMKYRVQ